MDALGLENFMKSKDGLICITDITAMLRLFDCRSRPR